VGDGIPIIISMTVCLFGSRITQNIMSRFPEIEIVATSLVNKDEYIRQAIDQRRVDKFWK